MTRLVAIYDLPGGPQPVEMRSPWYVQAGRRHELRHGTPEEHLEDLRAGRAELRGPEVRAELWIAGGVVSRFERRRTELFGTAA